MLMTRHGFGIFLLLTALGLGAAAQQVHHTSPAALADTVTTLRVTLTEDTSVDKLIVLPMLEIVAPAKEVAAVSAQVGDTLVTTDTLEVQLNVLPVIEIVPHTDTFHLEVGEPVRDTIAEPVELPVVVPAVEPTQTEEEPAPAEDTPVETPVEEPTLTEEEPVPAEEAPVETPKEEPTLTEEEPAPAEEAPMETPKEEPTSTEVEPVPAEDTPVETPAEEPTPTEEEPAPAEVTPVETPAEEPTPTEEEPAPAEEAPVETPKEEPTPIEEDPAPAEEAPVETPAEELTPAQVASVETSVTASDPAERPAAQPSEKFRYSPHASLMENVDSVPYYTIERLQLNEADTHMRRLTIRPNPTADNLIVQIAPRPKGFRYDLMRIETGRIVTSGAWLGMTARVPLEECTKGEYLLNIIDIATGKECMYKITKSYRAVEKRK